MKKVVFVIRDRCVGGFTSSLSSLYNAIKDDYNVTVLQLTDMGCAEVSYSKAIMRFWWLTDMFYGDYTLAKGLRKIGIGFVRLLSKIDKKLERRIANHYTKIISDADCVIAFGEGFSTRFTVNVKSSNKVAWIHYEITHYPKSQRDLNIYGKYDRVVCVADTIAERMKDMYPSIADKITAIHNIFDENRIRNKSLENIDEEFHESINIISLGRLSPVKRFFLIPSIANILKQKGLSFKWWILGPVTSLSQKEQLLNEIRNQDVSGYVEWIGNRANPYSYIKKSDVLVSTSSTEACPMVFTEARVLDTLIVSADFVTAKEFVDNEIDGIVCPVDEIANNLYHLLTDLEYQERIKNNSRKRDLGNTDTLCRFANLVDKKLIKSHV